VALADHPRAWSLDDVTMTAEPVDGGWILTGRKLAVLAAEGTTHLVVIARGWRGMGAFVVPIADAGVTPVHSLDASRPLVEAMLQRVFVPHDHALGEPGSEASTSGISRALEERRSASRSSPVGTCDALFQLASGLLEGTPAIRCRHRLLPGVEAQNEQHVPRP